MAKVRKALMAAAVAALSAAGSALLAGGLTASAWGVIAGAAVAAFVAVWRVPNAPAAGGAQR